MGPCGPLVGLGAPLWPPGTSKSSFFRPFRVPLAPLWAPRGAIWIPLGVILGTFVCQKSCFLPCDVQAHFLHHFGCFLEHFGSVLGVFWVELGFQIVLDLEKALYAQT